MQKRKGFTLVELVIVIAVIAILAGVLIGTFASVINRANESAKMQEIKAQEIEQKAEDILKKIEDSNWYGWEDFEKNLAEKLVKAYKETATVTDTNAVAAKLEEAVTGALTSYFANNKVENTSLTEEQVKAIIENALVNTSLGGVTEAQVKAIVNTATRELAASQLNANQVKSIVNTAVGNGLNAFDVTQIVTNALNNTNLTTIEQKVDKIITDLASVTKTSDVEALETELKEYIDGLKIEVTELQAAELDVVAAKAFNVVLDKSNVEVKSIFDVYDLFDSSTYDIKHYSAQADNRTLYYDIQLRSVVCVDNESGKIISPDVYEGEEQNGHDWLALDMTITPATEIEASRYVLSNNGTTLAVTVNDGHELAYVVNQLNTSNPITSVTIDLDGETIDVYGGDVLIKNVPANKNIVIQNGTIKNTATDTFTRTANSNEFAYVRNYNAAAIIGRIEKGSSVEIKNVVFENLYVRNTDTGNVALLCADVDGTLTVDNVTVKNSCVIGHRNVGSLIGIVQKAGKANGKIVTVNFKNNISVINTEVKTVGGRSGRVIGFANYGEDPGNEYNFVDCTLDYSTVTLSIYECEQNTGTFNDVQLGYNPETKKIYSYYTQSNVPTVDNKYFNAETAIGMYSSGGSVTMAVLGYNPN